MTALQLVHLNHIHPELFEPYKLMRRRAAELITTINRTTWDEIKNLLESHFGDTRDLTALIQDLQRMRQIPGESPLTFVSRLQTHEAKLHASVHKQHMTLGQKQAQIQCIGIHGLEPKLGHVIRASNPRDMLTAISRVRRELQLNYFENQKFGNRSNNNANQTNQRKPNGTPITNVDNDKIISKNTGNYQNFSKPNYQSNSQSNFQQRPYQPQQNQNFQQNRPPVITPNPNFAGQRPPAIQPNPNFRANHQNKRTFHVNENQQNTEYDQNYYTANNSYDNYYTDNSYDQYDYSNPNVYNNEYTDNLPNDYDYYENEHSSQPTPVYDQDFHIGPPIPPNPPETQDTNVSQLQNKIGNLNLDSFDPNLNFPEQRFTDN
ncbi:hypothetical protein NQ317_001015 [Molorchus minor]|uniref:GATA zinc finger domain-containing protein 14-like n=1 Tax=Molorchus minor TaxID=1323400 RepID=A0ABQ9IRF8_9CUCU|nr:hypothetical protein NQ317_001015 [Molorchus minor]